MKVLLFSEGLKGVLQQLIFLKSRGWDAEEVPDEKKLLAKIRRYFHWKTPPALVVVGNAEALVEISFHPSVRLLPVPSAMPGDGGAWRVVALSLFIQEALVAMEKGA